MTPKPQIVSTHKPLPFGTLSPLEFERMCLWLVEREGYERPQHLGEAGSEQGRDVVAYKFTDAGTEVWYFNCRRYKRIGASTFKKAIDKYNALTEVNPSYRPHGIVFITNAVVSARVRDAVATYCQEHGYAYDFWAHTELDMLVKKHPDVVREFFDASSELLERFVQRWEQRLERASPPSAESTHTAAIFDVPASLPVIEAFVGREEELRAIRRGLVDRPVAVIEGMAGSGKSWLAARLAREMGFDERTTLWISLKPSEDVSVVWHWIGVALDAQGYSELSHYLTDETRVGKGKWSDKASILAAGLNQHRLLIVLDNLQNANLLDESSAGWRALFGTAVASKLKLERGSRCILLSREYPSEFLKQAALETHYLFHWSLGDLPQEVIFTLAQWQGVELSLEEADALYTLTAGHALAVQLVLGHLATLYDEERETLLKELPHRAGRTNLSDPLVQFVVGELTADLEPEEQYALQFLSLVRRSEPAQLLALLPKISSPDLLLERLRQRHLVEVQRDGYRLHALVRQVFLGELVTDVPEQAQHFHYQLGEYYQKQGNKVEALYHLTQAGDSSAAVNILLSWNPDLLPSVGLSTLLESTQSLWNTLSAEQSHKLALRAGQAAERLGLYEYAIDWYGKALDAADTLIAEVTPLRYWAWAHHRLGNPEQADQMLKEASDALAEAGGASVHEQALLYITQGRVWAERGRTFEAQRVLEHAFDALGVPAELSERQLKRLLRQDPDLTLPLAQAYYTLGRALVYSRPSDSEAAFLRARDLYERADSPWMVGVTWLNIGYRRIMWGELDKALRAYANARLIAEELGDQILFFPLVLANEAIIRHQKGDDWLQVEQDLKLAWELWRKDDRTFFLPPILHELGTLLGRMGRWSEAKDVLHEKVRLSQRLGSAVEEAWGQFALAEISLLRVEAGLETPNTAVGAVRPAMEAMRKLDEVDPYAVISCGILETKLALRQRNVPGAEVQIETTLKAYEGLDRNPSLTGKLDEVLAMVLARRGEQAQANEVFLRSLGEQVDCFCKAYTNYQYALALQEWGEEAKAQEEMRKALEVLESMPADWLAQRAREFLGNPRRFLSARGTMSSEIRRFLVQAGFDIRPVDLEGYLLIPQGEEHPQAFYGPLYTRLIAGRSPTGDDFTDVCNAVRQRYGNDMTHRVALVISDQRPEPWDRYRLYEIRQREGLAIVPLDSALFGRVQPDRRASDILEDEIDQATGQQNLYAISGPVSSDLSFFGRERVLQEIIDMLDAGQPVGIFGLRKVGKTSLIQRLQGRLIRRRPVAYMDIQGTVREQGVWPMYSAIVAAFVAHTQHTLSEFVLPDLRLYPDSGLPSSAMADVFLRDLRVLHNILGKPSEKERMLLIIDEVDRLLPSGATSGYAGFAAFFGQLRVANQQAKLLDLLVVGVDPALNRRERWQDHDNELYRALREVWMPPMSPDDVREMIESLGSQMGVRYEPEALQMLAQVGGGQPFVTRQICSLVVVGRLGQGTITVTAEEAQAAIEDFFVNDTYLGELWGERLDVTQHKILRELAQSPDPIPRARLLPPAQRQAVMAALRSLEEYTLVRRDKGGYFIAWNVFREWIRWMELGLEE